MPLKRLEIENFKSYRGHQVVGPFNAFAAVIGPNGSGKSNLMDAISFVLGVRSAQLRSSQLKDLIFRGRKMGRAGEGGDDGGDDNASGSDDDDQGEGTATKASVTAIYEDAKGYEHRFQRSITIAGNSEYRYNGRAIQYAQYNTKLEQFNILVKAKNFLVFQGDVEAVASQGAKELSRLIDQISGSLELKDEYERAKQAQERATDNSTFNFNKRRGINSELKQFREQKSEAEKFERLQQERVQHILNHILWRLFHINEDIELNTDFVKTQAKNMRPLRTDHKRADEAVLRARRDQGQTQTEILQVEKSIKRKQRDVEDLRPTLDAYEEKIAISRKKLDNGARMTEHVERDLAKQQANLTKLERDRETVQRAADRAAQDQQRALESAGLTLSEADLGEYHNLKAQANLEAVAERQELDGLKREARIKTDAVKDFQDKTEQFSKQKDKLKDEEATLSERHSSLETKRNQIDTDLQAARAELNRIQAQQTAINQRETKLNDTLQVCYNKLLQAGNDLKEVEREAAMKETIAKLQRIFPGVRGRVVDLCKPVQRKYDTAISTVLGRNTDAIVVDYEKTAIDCIEYLRNTRSGQATFLPLDRIQAKPINDRLRSIARGARLAVDVIQFDASIERAIHHACGNALVCDTMDIARSVVYDKKVDAKAVTLEGTVIHKSGLITGGQSSSSGGKRWEEREVQGLTTQRDKCLAELKELQREKRAFVSDDEMVAKITGLEADLRSAQDELAAVNTRLTGIRDELKNIDKQTKEMQPKLRTAKTELEQLQRKMSTLEEVVNREEDRIFAAFCRRIGVDNIREYEERQVRLMERQSDARLQFESQLARLNHQANFERQQIESTQERLETLRQAIAREGQKLQSWQAQKKGKQEQLDGMLEEIQELQAQLTQLQTQNEAKKATLEEKRVELQKAARLLDSLSKEIAARNDEIEGLGSERAAIYRRCRLEEIALPLLKGSLAKVGLEETIDVDAPMDMDDDDNTQKPLSAPDFGIQVDFGSLDDEAKEDGGASMGNELQTRIESITAEIEKMSPNMKAVERLDDTEAKLAETEKEFDRSRRQAKEARDEFNRIKKRRCDLFNSAFNHISKMIDPTYKDLSRSKAAPMGGSAYLSIENTEEPYLGGITYSVVPPMKRFRDITALSGGEKTMAALALLFAIHSFQPAPFFVLDEVDAALDSQNVAKVSNYIRDHASDQFQFIVISLKASLYERSQSLVGIYRDQDVNSSSSLTLDLEQYA
ncbi:probable SMC1-chromosome segregation protein [Sporisorium reilianum SRZ2]|uniref:Structural maintenance of chromosomes protein n=1 Tax=Sporisorium reilianum (strain SRZ2) TaxID=999809 RepID=E7A2D6_SPORE|nr:probable SMC1-chromosome segregation protein [Sporisorium reilianum SRZ2]